MEIVDRFLASYERQIDFYAEASHLVETRCDALLQQNGIRAIVSSRAKQIPKLRAKITQRMEEKDYQSSDAFADDIVDLAGARIALYFPGDLPKV